MPYPREFCIQSRFWHVSYNLLFHSIWIVLYLVISPEHVSTQICCSSPWPLKCKLYANCSVVCNFLKTECFKCITFLALTNFPHLRLFLSPIVLYCNVSTFSIFFQLKILCWKNKERSFLVMTPLWS